MIHVHDPRGTRKLNVAPVAARPPSLAGLSIGILDNGKENADALLERTAGALRERGATIVFARKPSFSRPAPDDVIDTLAHCRAVVTAHGG